MKTLANTGDVSLRSAEESARGAKTVQSRANDTNCYLLGGGKDLPTASLVKSIAKTLGIPLVDREHQVKWEIPVNKSAKSEHRAEHTSKFPYVIRNYLAWIEKLGPFQYCWRMLTRQFVKRILRSDLSLALPSGKQVHLPRESGFSSVVWVTRGAVDDGFEQFLRWFARPGTAFFDVGAHFGFYAVFLSDLHSPVVAFEPDARTVPSLRRNLSGIPGAICVTAAVSDHVGRCSFFLNTSSPESRVMTEGASVAGSKLVEVEVTTLDATWSRLGRPKVGTVKIDTEGHEGAVLAGALLLINLERPLILVEATAANLAPHLSRLDEMGYLAVVLSKRHYRRRQTARVISLHALSEAFEVGMLLLVPESVRSQPMWPMVASGEWNCAPSAKSTNEHNMPTHR